MKQLILRSSLTVAVCLLFSTLAFSQWRADVNSPSNPFNPRGPAPLPPGGETIHLPGMSSVYVSGFLGANYNHNLGAFSATCECTFEPGWSLANWGLAIGGDVTYAFNRSWGLILKVLYDDKHTTESFERDIETPIKVGGQVIIRDVRYTERASVSLAYGTVGLFGRWQPRLARWYIFLGPTVGLNLSNEIEHRQFIETSELTFIEDGNTERVVAQKAISDLDLMSDYTNYRLEGAIGGGYDYMLAPRLFLSPEIMVSYPITRIAKATKYTTREVVDWKVMTVRISVGIKYEAF